MLKKNRLFYLLSLASTTLFFLLQLFDPPLLREHIESKTFDLRMRLRDSLRVQPRLDSIVIVMVDEKSLSEIGRWPWSRSIYADLIDRVSAGKPRVVGFDIMLSEREGAEPDGRLAGALRRAGNVVLATAFLSEADRGMKAPAPPPDFLWDSAFMEVKALPGIDWKKWRVRADSVNPPLPELAAGAVLGHVTAPPDLDGTLRWELLSIALGDDAYPSLPLQVARIAEKVPMKEMVLFGGSGVRLGSRVIPTDLAGRVVINYRGKEGSFPYLSASDVVLGRVAPSAFADRIVLVGTSALGTHDQKVTPMSANMPGIEKNANVVQNILLNNFIRKSPGVLELAAIALTGILLVFFLPRLNAARGVTSGFGLIAFYILLSVWLLIDRQVWINLLYPVANMAFIVTVETVTKLFTEERRAREIRTMFSSYVSPKIVDALIANPAMAAMAGTRREVTILFADIIGFTTISEKLAPEEVVSMLNEYYREMGEIIFRWDGTLDKFVGDEIMAVWGAPTEQPNHAELAVRCALDMSDRLEALQEKWRAEGKVNVDCGIGVNTGEVVVGNVGFLGKKMDYTAIGNHVNIAARVEKLGRSYGTRAIITGNTVAAIWELIDTGKLGHARIAELDTVKVKGKEEEVKIYSLLPLAPEEQERPAELLPRAAAGETA
jgi:adenylate cyclase